MLCKESVLRKEFFGMVALAIFSSYTYSQTYTNSPYSRFGLGELQSGSYVNNIALGGISNALQNDSTAPYYINAYNPASLVTNRLTVFDFGISSNAIQLQTADQKYSSNKVALAYLALAFPVTKWWGASFGLIPYSSVGYRINDVRDSLPNIGTVKYIYDGEGGINQLYFGNGFRIKNLFLGANASYMFGNLTYNSRDSFPQISGGATTGWLNTKYVQSTRVSDFYLRFGMQYRVNFSRGWMMVLGATGSLKSNINSVQSLFAVSYRSDAGVEVYRDTLIYDINERKSLTLPLMVGGGITIRKGDKWLVGADYSVQDWSSFSGLNQNRILSNSNRLAFGVQYIPSKNAGVKESYVKKIHYRMGYRYSNSYLELRNTPLKDQAFTLGAGFPLRKVRVGETYSQSILNFALEVGQFGTLQNQLILQRYVKAVFSFTLNDRWFIKRKYN